MNRKLNHYLLFVCVLFICHGLNAQTHDEWIESSFKYIDENQLDSAEIALKSALKEEPGNPINPFLFNNLGTIQRRQNKNVEALESYTLALNRLPKNSIFLSARASLFTEMGQFQHALIDYTTLLEEESENAEALYQRGLLYLNIKNFEQAERDFAKMLELNPTSLYARLGYASFYKITGDYNEAEKNYNYLIDKEPENPAIYSGRAELYLLMEKPGKAMSDVNKAIRLSEEENPYLYIVRYKARILLHEKKAAIEDLDKAVSLGYDTVEAESLRKFAK